MPERIRLSRAKGWRMPENTVKVDRTTPWGNPFVVGKDGTQAECVDLYSKLIRGYVCLTAKATAKEQTLARDYLDVHLDELRGRNLACWCRIGSPCHADALLALANRDPPSRRDEAGEASGG